MKSLGTMGIVSSRTVVGFLKPVVSGTTRRIVVFTCTSTLRPRRRIDVHPTKLLPTLPAPGSATTRTNHKFSTSGWKTTGKDIVASRVFQAPSLAPRTLFGIVHVGADWMQSDRVFNFCSFDGCLVDNDQRVPCPPVYECATVFASRFRAIAKSSAPNISALGTFSGTESLLSFAPARRDCFVLA